MVAVGHNDWITRNFLEAIASLDLGLSHTLSLTQSNFWSFASFSPCPCHKCPGRGPGSAPECAGGPSGGTARVWTQHCHVGDCLGHTTATPRHCSTYDFGQTRPPSPAACNARKSRPSRPAPSSRWTAIPSSSWGSQPSHLRSTLAFGDILQSILCGHAYKMYKIMTLPHQSSIHLRDPFFFFYFGIYTLDLVQCTVYLYINHAATFLP